jgi:hypothetical protein
MLILFQTYEESMLIFILELSGKSFLDRFNKNFRFNVIKCNDFYQDLKSKFNIL